MNADYLLLCAELDPAARTVHVEFAVRNESKETWRASEGFGIGYHLFDAETGTLIVDGARVHAPRDLAPGDSAQISIGFELPPEDGRYQVLISAMREGKCWYYERGWPFVSSILITPTSGSTGPKGMRSGFSHR